MNFRISESSHSVCVGFFFVLFHILFKLHYNFFMIIGMRYSDFSGQYVYTENEEYKQVI